MNSFAPGDFIDRIPPRLVSARMSRGEGYAFDFPERVENLYAITVSVVSYPVTYSVTQQSLDSPITCGGSYLSQFRKMPETNPQLLGGRSFSASW